MNTDALIWDEHTVTLFKMRAAQSAPELAFELGWFLGTVRALARTGVHDADKLMQAKHTVHEAYRVRIEEVEGEKV